MGGVSNFISWQAESKTGGRIKPYAIENISLKLWRCSSPNGPYDIEKGYDKAPRKNESTGPDGSLRTLKFRERTKETRVTRTRADYFRHPRGTPPRAPAPPPAGVFVLSLDVPDAVAITDGHIVPLEGSPIINVTIDDRDIRPMSDSSIVLPPSSSRS